jgi:hypothetical protein
MSVINEKAITDGDFFTNELFSNNDDKNVVLSDENVNHKMKNYLNDKSLTLLNKKTIFDWLIDLPIASRLHLREAQKGVDQDKQTTAIQREFAGFVTQLATEQCGGLIGEEYGKSSTIDAIMQKDFDILLVVDATYRYVNILKDKMKMVKGFIIVEKGECKKYPDRYAVKLICSADKHGSLLMGMYMYALHSNAAPDKTGILELAGGYKNTPGLCSYTKFGFTHDNDLYGNNCFDDMGNMPMSVNLNESSVTLDQIIQVSIGKEKKLNIDDPNDTGLCSTYKPEDDDQILLQQQLASKIDKKRRADFKRSTLPNNHIKLTAFDTEIDELKKQITDAKKKKGNDGIFGFGNTNVENYNGCNGPGCTVSGGKWTTRKKKLGRKVKTRKSSKSRSKRQRQRGGEGVDLQKTADDYLKTKTNGGKTMRKKQCKIKGRGRGRGKK